MLGKQNLRLVTASLLIIFFCSLFTLYRIITSTPSPVIKQDIQQSHKLLSNPNYIDSVKSLEAQTFVVEGISDQVPVRYGSAILKSSPVSKLKTHVAVAENNFENVESEIKDRIEKVDKLCKTYHLGKYKWSQNNSNDLGLKEPPTPLYSYYFWNRERHLAWCPVYKAGSTSWLFNMMILAGFSEKELNNPSKQISLMARETYGDAEPDAETLEISVKLLIVRHPFQRLVSAYRDKLSNSSIGHEHGTHHFYLKYGQKIVQKFRRDKTISQIEPTWEEFVRYLLATNLIHYADDHWLPAYYSCTPCLVHYDIIAKLETYNRDQEYIIYKTGLEGVLKPRWNHKLQTDNRAEQVKAYFNQLTKSQIEALYKKYWFDFELFGYNYKDFLEYGKAEE